MEEVFLKILQITEELLYQRETLLKRDSSTSIFQ